MLFSSHIVYSSFLIDVPVQQTMEMFHPKHVLLFNHLNKVHRVVSKMPYFVLLRSLSNKIAMK